jgi:hypothetical protein
MGAFKTITGKAARATAIALAGPVIGVGVGVSFAASVPTPIVDEIKDKVPGLNSFDETWRGHSPAEVCQAVLHTDVQDAYLEDHQAQSHVLQCFSGNARATVIAYHPRPDAPVDLSDVKGEVIERSELYLTDGDGSPIQAKP